MGGQLLNGRIEIYSQKKAGNDKYGKEAKELVNKVEQQQEEKKAGVSPENMVASQQSQLPGSLFIDLVQTLNASLGPDYSFSGLKPEDFTILSVGDAVRDVNEHLAELTAERSTFLSDLWKEIDTAIGGINKCECFRLNSCPFAEELPTMWSFHYLFHAKDVKRIGYFSCVSIMKTRKSSIAFFDDDGEDEEDDDMQVDDDDEEDADDAEGSPQKHSRESDEEDW
jgi:hypothetical protein